MKLKSLVFGMATFVPGVVQLCLKGTGGTISARYCYSVWLRHLVMAKRNGLNPFPKIVAELGPGDSIGIGLAALISGCDKYLAFDVIEYASIERNIQIFDDLVALFRKREDIPGEDEFPLVKPYLDECNFPAYIFSEDRLQYALEEERIEKIRAAISNPRGKDSLIQYTVPWYDAKIIQHNSVDMIYSQAVLEHVDDLRNTYKSMHLWLKPTGFISNQIDFKCHGLADDWNGHWEYSDTIWKLIRGRRPYLLNRETHSTHIALMKEEGFKIVCDKIFKSESRLATADLASRFTGMSNDDLTTSAAFVQAGKNLETAVPRTVQKQ